MYIVAFPGSLVNLHAFYFSWFLGTSTLLLFQMNSYFVMRTDLNHVEDSAGGPDLTVGVSTKVRQIYSSAGYI